MDFPPGARPREALRAIGLERFAPPLLIAGQIDLGGADRLGDIVSQYHSRDAGLAGLLAISSNGTSPIGLASVCGLVNQCTAPVCSRLPDIQSPACITSAVPVFAKWVST